MSRSTAATAIMLSLFYGCSQGSAPPDGTRQTEAVGPADAVPLEAAHLVDAHTVVFREGSLASLRSHFLYSLVPTGPYWEPGASDIDVGRLLVDDQLGARAKEFPIRQYLGYIRHSRRIVQVRGLHSGCFPWHKYWKHGPIEILHSAGCVFTLDFDADTKEFLDLGWGTVGQ